MQKQIGLLKEIEAHPQPSLSPLSASGEAAVQELPSPPVEPTGLVVTMCIWPTTWLNFFTNSWPWKRNTSAI